MASKKLPQSYIESATFQQAAGYVPQALTAGQPIPISRALLKHMAFSDAFENAHGMTLAEARQHGFITLVDGAPVPAHQTPAAPAGQQGNNQS